MKVVSHLENALRLWEETFIAISLRLTALKGQGYDVTTLDGPCKYAKDFREYVLNTKYGLNKEFDWSKFVMGTTPETFALVNGMGGYNFFVPAEIYNWNRQSRRVYTMTPDLQALLALTNLDSITWNDISWPFDTFGVSLEIPIKGDNGILYDFILFTKIRTPWDNKRKLLFHLYATSIGNVNLWVFDGSERQKLERMLHKHQYQDALTIIDAITARCEKQKWDSTVFVVKEEEFSRDITEHVCGYVPDLKETTWKHNDWDEAVRIVAGIALYLRSLPSASPHQGKWIANVVRSKGGRVVGDPGHVCTITTSFSLTSEIKKTLDLVNEVGLRAALRELGAHFRSGHWRRPPGKGKIPEYEKTVHVMPTIVRRDRLEDGELPVGAVTTLT